MSNNIICPVIMAGGSGSRLWPLSRLFYPKQFLKLVDDSSMLQETISRLGDLPCSLPVVICNEQHRFIVAEQLRMINKLTNNIILEPVGRNTAPAIALAAMISESFSSSEDPLLLVLAADHDIKNHKSFRDAVRKAIPFAEQGKLVTFGIFQSMAEKVYGYIKIWH